MIIVEKILKCVPVNITINIIPNFNVQIVLCMYFFGYNVYF